MAASKGGMQVDNATVADPLVNADPWAQTPIAGAPATNGMSQEWPGWPSDKDLLQMELPAIPSAKVAC
eukprot:9033980-Karenia_brevis.AAC.1